MSSQSAPRRRAPKPAVIVEGVQPAPAVAPVITTSQGGAVVAMDFSQGGYVQSVTVPKGASVSMKF